MSKFAFFCDSLARGGAERVTIALSQFICDQGEECVVVTGRKLAQEYSVGKHIKRINLSDGNIPRYRFIPKLRKVFIHEDIETVIAMGAADSLAVIIACIGLKTKVIVSERNDPNQVRGKRFIKIISQFMMRFADGFVFQTKDAKEYYKKITGGRGVVIPNPILADNLESYSMCSQTDGNIVAVGRLTEQKNHKLLIRAFYLISSKYPACNMYIYGEGALRKELEQYIRSLHLENRVYLPGNQKNIFDKISMASVFVMSSDYEGMPNALIEAMALGLICISTDCPIGGPRELITNGKNGFLVEVGNEVEIANMIDFVLSNLDKMDELRKQATIIKKSLNINIIGKKWLDYIQDVSQRKSK